MNAHRLIFLYEYRTTREIKLNAVIRLIKSVEAGIADHDLKLLNLRKDLLEDELHETILLINSFEKELINNPH